MYTIMDISFQTGLSKSRLQRHVRNGDLVAVKVGKCYLISEESLELFLDNKNNTIPPCARKASSPPRKWKCRYYEDCLDQAIKMNHDDFPCEKCDSYEEIQNIHADYVPCMNLLCEIFKGINK